MDQLHLLIKFYLHLSLIKNNKIDANFRLGYVK